MGEPNLKKQLLRPWGMETSTIPEWLPGVPEKQDVKRVIPLPFIRVTLR
jgi:hypothetical protein